MMAPAPVPRVTLDTNCLLDVEKERPAAADVLTLRALHGDVINLRLVAAAATDVRAKTFYEFEGWLNGLGFSDCQILLPIGVYGIAFYGRAVYGDGSPTSLYANLWGIFEANGTPSTPGSQRHRRLLHDVLMMWSHLTYGGDVFVTRDIADFVDRGTARSSRSLEPVASLHLLQPSPTADREGR
jgi:hypothetical protein